MSRHAKKRSLWPSYRKVGWRVALAIAIVVCVAAAVLSTSGPKVAAVPQGVVTIYPNHVKARTEFDPRSVEVGVRFEVSRPGLVLGLRFIASSRNHGPHTGSLWDSAGHRLAFARFDSNIGRRWRSVIFSQPVAIVPGTSYVASYLAPHGYYDQQQWAFKDGATLGNSTIKATAGVFAYGPGGAFPQQTWHSAAYFVDVLFKPGATSTSSAEVTPQTTKATAASRPPPSLPSAPPTETPRPPASSSSGSSGSDGSGSSPSPGGFPGPNNTGVPSGVSLGGYSGPCTITARGTVINAKKVSCSSLSINAADVVITNSMLPNVQVLSGNASVKITDSEIDGGRTEIRGVGVMNVTLERVNVHGGVASVQCTTNCVILDSWLHGQYLPPDQPWHNDAYVSNGGSNVLLRHNTLACDTTPNNAKGACSADAAIYGDFSRNSNYTLDNNLFVANPTGLGYCLYAGYETYKPYGSNPSNIVIQNNVFQRGSNNKCGMYGPLTAYLNGNGDVWSGNRWDNGATLTP
jgi:Domain of unknown function (DUF4082)